jgi:cell wall assembly regulator SMI1
MQIQLEALNKHLQTARPGFYVQLNEPLSTAEINALEEKLNVKLPIDLRTLYQWKNGQNNNCYGSFVNNSMFMPLQEALESAAESTSMIGFDFEIENWWNAQWIPVFQNGGGDQICYDMGGTFTGQPGQLIEFWHADNYRKVIAPNLESFLTLINRYYATTAPAAFDEFFSLEEEIEGFPKRFLVE